MKRAWLALDQHFIDDERIVDFAEAFGPGAISSYVTLLCTAKQAGVAGVVEIGYRALARKAFLDGPDEARRILDGAVALGLLEVAEAGEGRVSVTFPRWERYQRDPFRADRDGTSTRPSHDRLPTGTETKTGTKSKPLSPSGDRAKAVREIFDAWVEATGRDPKRTQLSDERRRLIERRLKKWPSADLIAAVRGWRHSPHHRGENDRGRAYNDLELLLRDAKHIEEFRDLEQKRHANGSGALRRMPGEAAA